VSLSHHLQIALAQELEGLPRARKQPADFCTGFIEGWGLYTEKLVTSISSTVLWPLFCFDLLFVVVLFLSVQIGPGDGILPRSL